MLAVVLFPFVLFVLCQAFCFVLDSRETHHAFKTLNSLVHLGKGRCGSEVTAAKITSQVVLVHSGIRRNRTQKVYSLYTLNNCIPLNVCRPEIIGPNGHSE